MARKACALRASHGLLHLSPGPSPGREGVAAHRRIEHPTNTNRTPNTDRKLVQTGNPVQIEKLAQIGNPVQIGGLVLIGNLVQKGNLDQIGSLVQIGNPVQIGDISCAWLCPSHAVG